LLNANQRVAERNLRAKLLESGLLDPEYYVRVYPDVRAARIDPALHYIRHGGVEGRTPSAEFDAEFYLATNLDIRISNSNPL